MKNIKKEVIFVIESYNGDTLGEFSLDLNSLEVTNICNMSLADMETENCYRMQMDKDI
ncbi:MAG: hypothetical protein ACRC1T_05330 [Clostridium chrysemydis]|uniref:hypothetical protein n=1 Tax=Clostridium chrysemydis TaxID=2665504 RepID=UPI003F36232B